MRQRNLNREIEPTCGLSHPSEGTHEQPPIKSPRTPDIVLCMSPIFGKNRTNPDISGHPLFSN